METKRVEMVPGRGEVIKFEISSTGRVDSLDYGGIKFARELKPGNRKLEFADRLLCLARLPHVPVLFNCPNAPPVPAPFPSSLVKATYQNVPTLLKLTVTPVCRRD